VRTRTKAKDWAKIRCYAHKFNLQKGSTPKISLKQNIFKDFWITVARFMYAKFCDRHDDG